MSKNQKTIKFTVTFHPNDPKKSFDMHFSEAQVLCNYVRAYFDKNSRGDPLLIQSETITENIHGDKHIEQSDHKEKKIEVVRWTYFETMTRGFLQWVRDHGVEVNSEPKFQVIIEQKYPNKIYVNFSANEAQELYDFVKRDLWVHGEPLWVVIDTDNNNQANNMRVKEITRHGQISPKFLPWLNSFGFNVKDENVR